MGLRLGGLRSRSHDYRQMNVTRYLFEKCNGRGIHSAEKQPLEFNRKLTGNSVGEEGKRMDVMHP